MATTIPPAQLLPQTRPLISQSEKLLAMLHRHPSVSSDAATVPVEKVPSESVTLSHTHQAGSRPNRLQTLLDFVRRENRQEGAGVNLSDFLLRVQSERDEIEASLHAAATDAGAKMVDGLIALLDCEKAARGLSSGADQGPDVDAGVDDSCTSTEDAAEGVGLYSPVTQNQWSLHHTKMAATPVSIWERQKAVGVRGKTTESESQIPREELHTTEVERMLRNMEVVRGFPKQKSYQQTSTVAQRHEGSMRFLERLYSNDQPIDGVKEIPQKLPLDPEVSAVAADERDLHWAEWLLQPLSVNSVILSEDLTLGNWQASDTALNDLQTRPSDYETIGLDVNAIKIRLPQPASRAPDEYTTKFCQTIDREHLFADTVRSRPTDPLQSLPVIPSPNQCDKPLQVPGLKIESIHLESALLDMNNNPTKEAKMQVEGVAEASARNIKVIADEKLDCGAESPEPFVKKTAPRLTSHQDGNSTTDGPDHFLSLLDLVKKL